MSVFMECKGSDLWTKVYYGKENLSSRSSCIGKGNMKRILNGTYYRYFAALQKETSGQRVTQLKKKASVILGGRRTGRGKVRAQEELCVFEAHGVHVSKKKRICRASGGGEA